ncbi:MAG: glycosyltransferase family 4 protein, partial [Planctomycetes bacterium]|nr:glycosyltransferase family 4 protein [Planctomycetota bacterium]
MANSEFLNDLTPGFGQLPLNVWLITVGEPLPIDGAGDRLLRTGILAERLRRLCHQVVWWSSGFDHIRKRHREPRSGSIDIDSGYQIQLLESSGYRTNVSFQRMLDHRQLAFAFRRKAPTCERPDVILCSWPTLELCDEAVTFGRLNNIPVILDVRDMWPDVLVNVAPTFARPLAKFIASPLYRISRRACQDATAVTAITDGCIDWVRQLAGMTRQNRDRAFPLAYREKSPSESEQHQAVEFWKQLGITSDGQFTACFFGTFGRQFELDTILNAAKQLHESHSPIRFVLCGAGPDLTRCQALARNLPNVLIPGWVNA